MNRFPVGAALAAKRAAGPGKNASRPRPLLHLVALLLAAAPAVAGYRSQLQEWEAYQPPALYPAAPAGKTAVPAGAEELRAQAERLRLAGARWARAAEDVVPGESFVAPDPALLEALRPAAVDPAAAGQALADGFSPETLEALALLRSPAVAARQAQARAAAAAYGQAASLDEVLRQYAVFTAGLMPGVGSMESAEAIAARFPYPGVLALKGRVAEQGVRAAREALEAARREAATGARRVWWELGYLHRAREITADMLVLLDHLKDAAAARYGAGETTFQDVVKVGIEREKVTEELATLGQEIGNAQAEVRELLALPPATAVGRPGARPADPTVPAVEPLYALASEKRQELRGMRAMVGKMEAMIEMAETMVYPRFHLDLSGYERDEGAAVGGGEGMAAAAFPESTEAGMGAGLPRMPWYGTQDAYLQETRARLAALRQEVAMEEAAAALRVRETWFRLDRAAREQGLVGDRVLTLTEAALEASTRGYAAGKVMFADVIMSYTGWLETQLALERRRADRGIAAAELEAAVGVSPLTAGGKVQESGIQDPGSRESADGSSGERP